MDTFGTHRDPQFNDGSPEILVDVPVRIAKEMAAVGIVPSFFLRPVGHVFVVADQRFVVTGNATRQELLEAVARAGFDVSKFATIPGEHLFLLKISTD